MSHVVLLGDSIFDNFRYVGSGLSVIQQVGTLLPNGSLATLLAVDGSVTADVEDQLAMLPPGATHVVVSCGGNDALGQLGTLQEKTTTLITALGRFSDLRGDFDVLYSRMLDRLLGSGIRIAVCTIYDAIPGMDRATLCAIALYNDVIVRRAAIAEVTVLELRAVCVCPEDYSAVSPIEPSSMGGAKIARLIAAFASSGPAVEVR